MPTSVFFNQFEFPQEQNLVNDLVVEMIKIHGINLYYIPRTMPTIDPLFGESPNSSFNAAILIEMYLKNYLGFGGDGDLMSKFGLTTGDTITFCLARDRFYEDIGAPYNLLRPNEGDLIYFPFTKGIFEIMFVEHEATFYQTGTLQFFEIRCQKFNYSGENMNTGIPVIDGLQAKYSTGSSVFHILTENGSGWLVDESGDELEQESYDAADDLTIGEENQYFETGANTFIDFNVTNPFSDDGTP